MASHATQGTGQGLVLFLVPLRAAGAGSGAVCSRRLGLGRMGLPWPPEVGWEALLLATLVTVGSYKEQTALTPVELLGRGRTQDYNVRHK